MLRTRLLLLAVGFVLFGSAGPALAATIMVNTNVDDTAPGDGQCSLRKAIEDVDSPGSNQTDCAPAAFGANTIVLGAGNYFLGGPSAITSTELTVAPTVPSLTISGAGEGQTTVNATALPDRVLSIAQGANVTIQNLTLTGGNAPAGAAGSTGQAGGAGASGGAILNQGTLTVSDAAITGGIAGSGGPGAAGSSSGSAAGGSGSAGGQGGSGGAIYNTGTLTLNGAAISGNSAGAGGQGGVGGQGGTSGGSGGAGGAAGDGGAITNAGGSLTVEASTISGNSAGSGGSGGNGGSGSATTGGNGGAGGAGANGGGIATDGGTLSVVNSTFASNSAGAGGAGGTGGAGHTAGGSGAVGGGGGSGGGLAATSPQSASLLNVTAAGNSPGGSGAGGTGGTGQPAGGAGTAGAAGAAGGVFDQGSTTTLQNSLLALNAGGNCSGSLLDGGYNLSFGDSTCPATFAGGNPNLGALQDNGGPTKTISLGSGSAAIDQIRSAGSGCPPTDQRGVPRPSGPKCDIGAYEVAPPLAVTDAPTKTVSTGATLAATVTPNGGAADTTVSFQYGTTTRYGTTKAIQGVGGVVAVPVLLVVTGLKRNTTYHYRVVVTTPDGMGFGADRTFVTSVTPMIRSLRIKPAVFRPGGGAAISYLDSRAATTTFTVLRCAKLKAGKCIRPKRARVFRHHDVAGHNRLRLAARAQGHELAPATYLLEATPRAAGRTGATATAVFKIS